MGSQSSCCVQEMKVIMIFLFHWYSTPFKVELGMEKKKKKENWELLPDMVWLQ